MRQGDSEWLRARAGKFSASRFGGLMAKGRGGKPGATYENLIFELAVERYTGEKAYIHPTYAMQRGIDLEPEAREAYEAHTFQVVEEVPIVVHPEYDFITCSPDGLVGDDGLCEIKCLELKNHAKSITEDYHVKTYAWQCHGQMMVTGRQWCDLTLYHPGFQDGKGRLFITRIEKDPKKEQELLDTCLKANKQVDKYVEKLRSKLK